MSRFDYVKYDADTQAAQESFKIAAVAMEAGIECLPPSRATSLALTKLEECYMWIGKALRDGQIVRNVLTPLNESRDQAVGTPPPSQL